jgi:hypothetical protein
LFTKNHCKIKVCTILVYTLYSIKYSIISECTELQLSLTYLNVVFCHLTIESIGDNKPTDHFCSGALVLHHIPIESVTTEG